MITEMLLMVLIAVESNGNDFAKGDNGDAIGCLQIHKEVITDVNRIYGTTYRWPESCYIRETSKEICRMYLKHYAPQKSGAQILSRIWNGGPRGHKKQATLKYWERVKKEIK